MLCEKKLILFLNTNWLLFLNAMCFVLLDIGSCMKNEEPLSSSSSWTSPSLFSVSRTEYEFESTATWQSHEQKHSSSSSVSEDELDDDAVEELRLDAELSSWLAPLCILLTLCVLVTLWSSNSDSLLLPFSLSIWPLEFELVLEIEIDF